MAKVVFFELLDVCLEVTHLRQHLFFQALYVCKFRKVHQAVLKPLEVSLRGYLLESRCGLLAHLLEFLCLFLKGFSMLVIVS